MSRVLWRLISEKPQGRSQASFHVCFRTGERAAGLQGQRRMNDGCGWRPGSSALEENAVEEKTPQVLLFCAGRTMSDRPALAPP
jgi:hypothetical protein